MISSNLSSLLSDLGWGSGFRLPVANAENKALESLLEQKQRDLLRLNAVLESDTQHCEILKSHLERVSKSVTQSQKMISAKQSGIDTEENLVCIADRVLSRTKADLTKTMDTVKDYRERNQRMSNDVEVRRQTVEELVATVKFDRAALERYQEVSQEKESDIEYMVTLTKLDERVAENFQLKFAKAGEELSTTRRILTEAAMHTQTLQRQFNRLCVQFRRLHVERGQAVSFWEATLRSMQQRDNDIKGVAEEYSDIRVNTQVVESHCSRKRKMLEAEKQNTRTLDYRIQLCDKTCGDYRVRVADGKEQNLTLKDEILSYNTTINQTSRMVKDIHAKISNHESELAVMQQKLDKAEANLRAAKDRYDMAMMDTMSEEAKAREYEQMIEQEEQRMDSLIQDLEKQRRFMWQRSNDLTIMEQKVKAAVTQIKGTKTMIVALRDRAKNDDVVVQKRRQQVYHLELECLGLDSRIQKLLTTPPLEVLSGSKKDIGKMKEKLMEITKTKTFLTSQESHLTYVNRRIKRDIHTVLAEHAQLKLFIETEKMEAKRCSLDAEKTTQELQDSKVEHRILEMTLKRLERWARQERDKKISLEQERAMMEVVAQERRLEINMHMNLLKSQQKQLKEDRNKLAGSITEMLAEIERIKTRYAYIVNAMNMYGGDEAGHTESYYILKHAQEKEALKREGDLWDAKVKESEKEIAALQNTLSVIVSSNMAFKESLAPAAGDTPEAKLLSELEDGHRQAQVNLRKAKRLYVDLRQKYETRMSELTECKHGRMWFEGLLGEKKYELNNVHFEITNQKSKIERANRMASRVIKELGLHLHEDRETIEADLKLRCAREKFEFALKTLEKSLFLHEELRDPTVAFLERTELDSLTARLRKRIRAREGTESPYYSGQVTPVRYLTPVSSTAITQPLVPKESGESAKPATPPTSLASKPTSAVSRPRSRSATSLQSAYVPSDRSSDLGKKSQMSVEEVGEEDEAETTTLFMSDKQQKSRSEIFENVRASSAKLETKPSSSVRRSQSEEQKDKVGPSAVGQTEVTSSSSTEAEEKLDEVATTEGTNE